MIGWVRLFVSAWASCAAASWSAAQRPALVRNCKPGDLLLGLIDASFIIGLGIAMLFAFGNPLLGVIPK
jgi:F-type H+-transporting ATPase subunit c